MNIKVQYYINSNPFLKKYLQEHSYYYKNIIRNPNFINELSDLAKKEYGLTFTDKLEKIKNNIGFVNTFMDVLK